VGVTRRGPAPQQPANAGVLVSRQWALLLTAEFSSRASRPLTHDRAIGDVRMDETSAIRRRGCAAHTGA
jgi:hypothetical protein